MRNARWALAALLIEPLPGRCFATGYTKKLQRFSSYTDKNFTRIRPAFFFLFLSCVAWAGCLVPSSPDPADATRQKPLSAHGAAEDPRRIGLRRLRRRHMRAVADRSRPPEFRKKPAPLPRDPRGKQHTITTTILSLSSGAAPEAGMAWTHLAVLCPSCV